MTAFYAFLPEPPPPRTSFPPPETNDASRVDDEDKWTMTPSGQVVVDVLCRFPEARAAVLEGLNRLRKRAGHDSSRLPDPPGDAK